MSRVFANGPEDRGSIPCRVIAKTQKIVLDTALFSIIKSGLKVKWSNPVNGLAPPLHVGVVVIEKGAFRSTSTKVTKFTYLWFRRKWTYQTEFFGLY